MRDIEASNVTEVVCRLFLQANFELGADVLAALKQARQDEESPRGREVIDRILENADIAASRGGTTSIGMMADRGSVDTTGLLCGTGQVY